MFDVLIRHGHVIDGTRRARYRADVGLVGDRIAAVGNLANADARLSIDAAGQIVAPGFVDVHTHSDGRLLKEAHFFAKTAQGFTTEVLMADGISYAPLRPEDAASWLFYLRALNGLQLADYRGWKTIGEYMGQLDGTTVQNSIAQVPYANVRVLANGFGGQPVDDFQMLEVKARIRQGMEDGAVGLSTGLDYIEQCHATTDELVQACTVLKEYGGFYVTHLRYKSGLMTGLREAVEIGRRAGVPVHISHLKAQAAHPAEEVLAYIDQVARKEVEFTFDVYPYQPGSTMLNYLFPYEIWRAGPLAAMGRLHLPEIRSRIRSGLANYRLDLDHLRIAWVPTRANAEHQGKTLREYIEESGRPAEDALCDLLLEERLAVLLVLDEGNDALVHPFLQHDLYMMGSDGIYHADGHVHPRVYGSAGRLLGPCVREHKLFSLEDAVYKLSGFPAQRFGLQQRGELREDAFADIVVFDPETVTDRATYAEPHQTTRGISQVLVNGVPIIAAGREVTPLARPLPGRALRYRA